MCVSTCVHAHDTRMCTRMTHFVCTLEYGMHEQLMIIPLQDLTYISASAVVSG